MARRRKQPTYSEIEEMPISVGLFAPPTLLQNELYRGLLREALPAVDGRVGTSAEISAANNLARRIRAAIGEK